MKYGIEKIIVIKLLLNSILNILNSESININLVLFISETLEKTKVEKSK